MDGMAKGVAPFGAQLILVPTAGGWAILGAFTPHDSSDVRRATQGVSRSSQG